MDRIKSVFDSANIYEVRAALDVFMLMAQIAQEDNARMLEMADPERGHEPKTPCRKLIRWFTIIKTKPNGRETKRAKSKGD